MAKEKKPRLSPTKKLKKRIRDFIKDLEMARGGLTDARVHLVKVLQDRDDLRAKLTASMDEVSNFRDALAGVRKLFASSENNIKRLEGECLAKIEACSAAEARIAQLAQELASTKEELGNADERIAEKTDENAKLAGSMFMLEKFLDVVFEHAKDAMKENW